MNDLFTHNYHEVNGIRLHAVQVGPEEGPLVVLLHGFPEFWRGWINQLCPLAGAGYRVIVPDQRGYNLSDKPKGIRQYRLELLAADVAGLVSAAGRQKAAIVGHDWGGLVAWATAVLYPSLVERLVIMNAPYPVTGYLSILRHPTQLLRSLYVLLFQLPWLPERLLLRQEGRWMARGLQRSARPGSFSDEEMEAYRQSWLQPGGMTSMLNYYRALIRYPARLPASPQLKMPALMLWGAQDPALGRYLASASARSLENGRLIFYEDATHWVQHDEAQKVNRELLHMLQEIK